LLRLTPVSNDGGEVAAAFVALAPGGQLIAHHAAFAPWASWPASGELSPVHATFIVTASVPFVDRSTAGHYALAAGSPLGNVSFFAEVDPNVEGDGTLTALGLAGIDAEFLAARAPGLAGPTHLVGT